MPLAAQLYHLQTLDSRIAALEGTLASLDDGSALQAHLEEARGAESTAQAALHDKQSSLRVMELELQSTVGKVKKLEQDLYSGRVANPKELQAMEADIQMLSRQRGRTEEDVLNLMEQIEKALEDERGLEKDRQAKEAAFAAHLEGYRQRKDELTRELETTRAERETYAPQIDPDLLRRYERLRGRLEGIAVVKILNGICGGCHFKLPGQLVTRVKEEDVVLTCEECGRVLYGGP
jgi:predicted  nucleic acid-binding Zn-ribbon protein